MKQLRIDYPLVEHRLDNGLRMVLNPDASAPGVALNLWYRVGSGDETQGGHGFAHLFEHLMFQGSSHVASAEHLAAIQAAGGTANATTSFDRTNYFETVPPNALRLALWLEADRMASLDVNQTNLATQRDVVKEEKAQRYDNVPYGDQLALLLERNFPSDHPYAHPTIGSAADLDAASLDEVRAFHAHWYHPAGALLVLSGALDVESTISDVEEFFGGIGGGAVPDYASPPPLPPHSGVPRTDVARDVPRDLLHLCWRTPPLGTRSSLAVNQVLAILTEGQASRLHRRLVRELELAEAIGGDDFSLSRGTSLAVLTVRPREGVELGRLEDEVVACLADLADHGPAEDELERVTAGFERDWLSTLASVDSRADSINEAATLLAEPFRVNTLLDELGSINAGEVIRSAATILHPDSRAEVAYHAERH